MACLSGNWAFDQLPRRSGDKWRRNAAKTVGDLTELKDERLRERDIVLLACC